MTRALSTGMMACLLPRSCHTSLYRLLDHCPSLTCTGFYRRLQPMLKVRTEEIMTSVNNANILFKKTSGTELLSDVSKQLVKPLLTE